MTSDVLDLLCSSMKLERDKGICELQKFVQNSTSADRVKIEHHLIRLLSDSGSPWETKHGCLLAAKCLVSQLDSEDEQEIEFLNLIKPIGVKFLTDVEERVRLAAGELLGALCDKIGPIIYQEYRDSILNQLKNNLERHIAEDDGSKHEQMETEKLMEKLVGTYQRRNSPEAAQIFHDTAGWKNLETSIKCLQAIIEGSGAKFQTFADEELFNLIFQILSHSNHFVRETGFYLCASLVNCGNISDESNYHDCINEINPIFSYGSGISKHLADGLSDNWSPVRLAASVATRKFLMSLPHDGVREILYSQLLPRMCLNRYYVAEGVRNYSQETWRQVTGSSGKELVEKYINSTVDYYIEASESESPEVREAACNCISELASKIELSVVRPHVQHLLHSLLQCCKDICWPVRDAACLACGSFVLRFPEETRHALPLLYPMFFTNLGDPIATVRHGAAASLGNMARAYGEESISNLADKALEGFKGLRDQPPSDSTFSSELPPLSLTPPTLVKRIRDYHGTEKNMYSSKKSTSGFDKKFPPCPSQPWEIADGCVCLISELALIPEAINTVFNTLPSLAIACTYRHYAAHYTFLETVCKHLPIICKGVGKKMFKSMVEDFFDAIFYALECENALTSSAASQCLNQISTYIGPSILRAKVQNHNSKYLHHLDANIYIAPF